LELSGLNPSLKGHYLFATTEMNSKKGIEFLIKAVKEAAL